MRALFLSDLETRGGAAIAASRLARGLCGLNVDVTRLFGVHSTEPFFEPKPWKSVYGGFPRAVEVALNGMKRGAPGVAAEAGRVIATHQLHGELSRQSFDVLHAHALHNSSWDHRALRALDPDLPTVWTFHDHWGFSPESYLFRDGAGVERRLKPDGPDRASALRERRDYFKSRRRLRLVANSVHTARYATECLDLPVEVVHYGLPLDLFNPLPKDVARRALQLPQQGWFIGFSSDSNADPVKGFDVLRGALELSGLRARAIAMGSAEPREYTAGEVSVRLLGRVDNPLFQSIVYSACDLFVVPSRAEALGLVAMESVSCGTPVVASNVGGLPDVVLAGRSGWLFEAGHTEGLAERLRYLESTRDEVSAVAAKCRSLAESAWTLERQAQRYLQIYRELGCA